MKIVANLIKCIEAGTDPAGKMEQLGKEHGGRRQSIMREILQPKSAEHGRNLIMHAAALGKKSWFIALVKVNIPSVYDRL